VKTISQYIVKAVSFIHFIICMIHNTTANTQAAFKDERITTTNTTCCNILHNKL